MINNCQKMESGEAYVEAKLYRTVRQPSQQFMKVRENGEKINNVVSAEPRNGRAGTKSRESILRTHPFLQGMSEHQYRILSDCAMQSHFGADELIFCEGDPANGFYLIQKGKVALESHTEESGIVRVQV